MMRTWRDGSPPGPASAWLVPWPATTNVSAASPAADWTMVLWAINFMASSPCAVLLCAEWNRDAPNASARGSLPPVSGQRPSKDNVNHRGSSGRRLCNQHDRSALADRVIGRAPIGVEL